jgi:hypothetical protein
MQSALPFAPLPPFNASGKIMKHTFTIAVTVVIEDHSSISADTDLRANIIRDALEEYACDTLEGPHTKVSFDRAYEVIAK